MKGLAVRSVLTLLCVLAGGCATAPPPPSPVPFFHDERFAAAVEQVSADDVFAMSDAMKTYLQVDIARELRSEGRQRGLLDALYKHGELKLEYDATMTRTAAQAFDARAGNCLSLVLMTAAFAKELGLSVTYQSVAMDETWSRSDDIAFANGHVNVMLGPRIMDINRGYNGKPSLTIDFLPAEDILGQRTRPISEDTVVAMFMNNRSAEALVQGRIDDAYWWARAAVQRAPTFLAAFNTMGVIYLRHGDLGAAESVFKHVLKSRPQDAQALANLASLLDRSGRTDESRALHVRLSQIEPDPPYHFFRLGVVAMQRGDFAAARVLFKREVDRADYNGEFHFWLGVADLRLGDVDAARKQFAIALQNSTTRGDHDLYAAKLDRLRAYQTR